MPTTPADPTRMSVRMRVLVFLCLVPAACARVLAVVPQQMVDEAVREYNEALSTRDPQLRTERFRLARRLFGQVIEDKQIENADLYVNLGNSALQCEQMGQAILAYRRALEIEPGHSRALANLAYARQVLPQWLPRPQTQTLFDTFFFWNKALSRSGRALVSSLCFAAVAVLGAITIRWRRAWARNISVLLAVIWLALTGLRVLDRWTSIHDEVVVTVPQIVARTADSAGAPARFAEPLPAGTEARILEHRGDWVQIRLANNRDAWVRASSVTTVRVRCPS